MTLHDLVYYCVKNAIFFDDIAFTKDKIDDTNYEQGSEYGSAIQNVILPINQAIARLNELNRLPFVIEDNVSVTNNVIDLTTLSKQVKEVMSVGYNFVKLPHKSYGVNKIFVSTTRKKVSVEYKEDIPFFTKDDYDIDLYEYGINNAMISYIMEYTMGRLLDQISPTEANMHLSRAEQYFANINPVSSAFTQDKVATLYKVGE